MSNQKNYFVYQKEKFWEHFFGKIQHQSDYSTSKELEDPLWVRINSLPLVQHDPTDLELICLEKKCKVCFWIQEFNLEFFQRNAFLVCCNVGQFIAPSAHCTKSVYI